MKAFVLIALFLSLAVCTHGQTSNSKLSAHLINAYTSGSSNIVAGHPRVLKILDVGSGMVNAMRDYKANTPGGKVVLRIYSPQQYTLDTHPNAAAAATNFWNTILAPSLNSLSPSDRALIDYLEGPNEGQTPTLGHPSDRPLEAAQWFNRFWTNLTPLVVSAGFKPCIGSIAVGNPPGSPSEMQTYLAAFAPALRQARGAGGAWSYHAYSIVYGTDVNVEFYYSLRYRQFYDYFATAFPDLVSMPLILTEGGIDDTGNPNTSGWRARGPAAQYQRWLNWFDAQINQDPYVLGCTLFQNGDPGGWFSFELEPIAVWMRNYLTNPSTPPPIPTGLAASGGFNNVKLVWTNAPTSPTTYVVQRAFASGGPFTTLITGINTGVTNYSFVDTTATNGGTYYYAVIPVNAVGSGPPALASITLPIIVPSKINSGGSTVENYIEDIYFTSGLTYETGTVINTNGLINPAPMAVYQSQRYKDPNSELGYILPYLPSQSPFKVRLHFAEVYFTSPGQRVFNVLINGAPVLNNYDAVAAAGSAFKGNIQEFNAISSTNGTIKIDFASVIENPSCNGIELVPNQTNAIPSAPSNLSATPSDGRISLVWSAPPGATHFTVKEHRSAGGPYTVIATNLTATTFRDLSFMPGTTYYYVVTASNAFGESAPSNEASATPTVGVPDVVITGISWTPNPAFAGGGVLLRATVKNQGSAAWPAGTTLGVGFNVDGTGVSYSANFSSSLAVGGSILLTANGGGSPGGNWPATLGSHTVGALVDDVNRIGESDDSNNYFATNMSVFVSGYSINAGGTASGAFGADQFFSGGMTAATVNPIITAPATSVAAPHGVYQSSRVGSFSYTFPNLIPDGTYALRMHFAETAQTNSGQRRFAVNVNGSTVLPQLDIIAETQTNHIALVKRVNATATANGQINVQFVPINGDSLLSGIQILTTNSLPNALPYVAPLSNLVVNANSPVSFTAKGLDPDAPLQAISYSLDAGAPGGAIIHPTTGVFTWTPNNEPSTNLLVIRATDNGVPILSNSRSFSIVVIAPPRVSSIQREVNGNISIHAYVYPGKTYRVEYKQNLEDPQWTAIVPDIVATEPIVTVVDEVGNTGQRFYHIVQLD